MKILYIHDYPFKEGGGIEVQTYNDALALIDKGHEVAIASTRRSSETYRDTNKELEVPCIYIADDNHLENLIEVHELVSIQATFSLRPGMMGALKILSKANKKHIVCLRTTYKHIPFSRLAELENTEKENLLREFSGYLKNDLCLVQTVSHAFDETFDFLGIKKDYTCIYNAKDWGDFLKIDEREVGPSPVTITYVGEISWMKGLHVLITALPHVRRLYPQITVRVIGGGQDKDQLKAIIDCMNIDYVELIDYVPNSSLSSYFSATDILVIPSLTESWCNVAAEGLACGARIVASKVEGLAELLEGGKLGVLFKQGDAVSLASALIQSLDQDGQLSYAKHIQQEYTIERRVRDLENYYTEVLA